MDNCQTARVYFATADWRRDGHKATIRQRLRVLLRKPGRVWLWFQSWMVRAFTNSSLAHCAIGIDGVVLDQSARGVRFWPQITFEQHFPTLVCWFDVPLYAQVDMDLHVTQGGPPVISTFLQWATRGKCRPRNCLTIVVDVLRDGGWPITDRINTPRRLCEYLKGQNLGHYYHSGEHGRTHTVVAEAIPSSTH